MRSHPPSGSSPAAALPEESANGTGKPAVKPAPRRTRSCLHCALLRALQSEADAFASRGLDVELSRCEKVWLAGSGIKLYRALRRLLRRAHAEANGGPVKVRIVDVLGKSDVDVMVTVGSGRQTRVLHHAFPRVDEERLSAGFAEAPC